MLLNLKQLAAGAAGERSLDFACTLDMSRIALWGEYPFAEPVRIAGIVICRSGVYTIRYEVAFGMTGRCARCLKSVTLSEKCEFEHTVLVDADASEAEAAGFIPAPGAELDLDGLAVSDLLLEFGGIMLCGEDCRGLCPVCGKNLNDGDCGCKTGEPDPRFDAIRRLMEE